MFKYLSPIFPIHRVLMSYQRWAYMLLYSLYYNAKYIMQVLNIGGCWNFHEKINLQTINKSECIYLQIRHWAILPQPFKIMRGTIYQGYYINFLLFSNNCLGLGMKINSLLFPLLNHSAEYSLHNLQMVLCVFIALFFC